MTSEALGESDRVFGFKLIESLLMNCHHPRIDHFIPHFLSLACERLNSKWKSVSYFVHCLEVVCVVVVVVVFM